MKGVSTLYFIVLIISRFNKALNPLVRPHPGQGIFVINFIGHFIFKINTTSIPNTSSIIYNKIILFSLVT